MRLARSIALRRLSADYPSQHVDVVTESINFTKRLFIARIAAFVGSPDARRRYLSREASVAISHEGSVLQLVSYSEQTRKSS
jgi:hypothetical protein